MSPDEFENHKINYRKYISDFNNKGRISECFYHDKSHCNGNIKQSHSIQRNRRLSIIEGNISGQNLIYTFSKFEWNRFGSIETLIPIGKKGASTFFGFCEFHDTNLFSPIENSNFDNSDYHCFLHSYRSFAHSYHIKKESLKSYKSKMNEQSHFLPSRLDDIILGTELALQDLEKDKLILDELIQDNKYDLLEYLTYVIPEKFPIACASIINPEYSYNNQPINIDPNKPYSMVMLTVLPDSNQTIIILACFAGDKNGSLLLDELDSLKHSLFEKAISSLLINNAENTFFSPALWNALGNTGQKRLCKELETMIRVIPKGFVHSKINFFDKKFSSKSLGA